MRRACLQGKRAQHGAALVVLQADGAAPVPAGAVGSSASEPTITVGMALMASELAPAFVRFSQAAAAGLRQQGARSRRPALSCRAPEAWVPQRAARTLQGHPCRGPCSAHLCATRCCRPGPAGPRSRSRQSRGPTAAGAAAGAGPPAPWNASLRDLQPAGRSRSQAAQMGWAGLDACAARHSRLRHACAGLAHGCAAQLCRRRDNQRWALCT